MKMTKIDQNPTKNVGQIRQIFEKYPTKNLPLYRRILPRVGGVAPPTPPYDDTTVDETQINRTRK